MPPFDARAELGALSALYDSVDVLLRLDPERLMRVVPASSGWCAEQHLAHVTLANELVLRNIASLASGRGVLIVRGGVPHPKALQVLETGRIPRGEATAPRMVRPPEKVQRELLAQWLADGRRALGELLALDDAALAPSELKIPHQLLGPLDLPQWTRFGVVHTRHHLAIAEEVLGEASAERRGTPWLG